MIYSRRLEDDVIVTRDEAVDVPAKHSGLVRYAVQELIRMGELGKGPTLSVGELAAIHLVKTLGGTVVQ